MTPFSLALQDSLDDAGLSRKELLRRAAIEAPALSKYLTGRLLPSPSTLAKIMGCLPADQAAKVFTAYLKEIFPREVLERLPKRDDPRSPDAQGDRSSGDPELDEALELLAHLAKRRPEVKALLKSILDALQ